MSYDKGMKQSNIMVISTVIGTTDNISTFYRPRAGSAVHDSSTKIDDAGQCQTVLRLHYGVSSQQSITELLKLPIYCNCKALN